MGSIILIAARALQIICAAVVLAVSIVLIQGQSFGSVAAINYAAFTGGFGLLVGLIGAAAIFFEPLGGIIGAALDGLASLFLLAGGIAIAVKLRHVSCSSKSDGNKGKLIVNELTNGGCVKDNDGHERICGNLSTSDLLDRCKKNSADSAFMIITGVICLGMLTLGLLAARRGRKGSFV